MTSDGVVKKSTFNKLVLALIGTLVAASFMAGYIIGNTDTPKANPSDGLVLTEVSAPRSRVAIPISENHIRGDPDAPVTMIEYTDFQCPYCGQFFSQTLPLVERDYISKDKVKLVFKHMPLENIHPNANFAANAAECAGEQGRFWQYHDKLFDSQSVWAKQESTDAIVTFKQFGIDLGLEGGAFASCIDSAKYAGKIKSQVEEGRTYGVSGTPAFFIGSEKDGYTKLAGAQPFPVFQDRLNSLLD